MSDEMRIFISYARGDGEQGLPVYHRLKEKGFASWIDQKDLLPGMNRRGFIQREINTALDLWEEKMHDDIYFIPLRLEECEIPQRVDEFQCVNLHEGRG